MGTALPFSSNFGPALAFLNGNFFMAWTDQASVLRYAVSTNSGATWTPSSGGWPVIMDGTTGDETSSARPALAMFHGNLFIAWSGTNDARSISVAKIQLLGTKATFTNKRILSETSPFGPSLAGADVRGNLILSWTGSNEAHSICRLGSPDGSNWPAKGPGDILPEQSNDGPAIAVDQEGDLLMAWTSTITPPFLNFWVTNAPLKHVYNGDPVPGPDTSNEGPSLAYDRPHGNTWLAYSGQNPQRNMFVLSNGGGSLSPPSQRVILNDTSFHAPALCTPELPLTANASGLFLAWTATNGARSLCFQSFDTMAKSSFGN
jgi:hypothetical protein